LRDSFASSITQSIFLRGTSYGPLAGIIKLSVSVYAEATRETTPPSPSPSPTFVPRSTTPGASWATPRHLPGSSGMYLNDRKVHASIGRANPGSMVRGGAGSFARLVVSLWPPSRLDLFLVVLNLVRSSRSQRSIDAYLIPLTPRSSIHLASRSIARSRRELRLHSKAVERSCGMIEMKRSYTRI